MWIKKMAVSKFIFLCLMLIISLLIVLSCFFLYFNGKETAVNSTNRYSYLYLNELNQRIESDISKLMDTCYFTSMQSNLKRLIEEYSSKDEIGQLEIENQIIKTVTEPFQYRIDINNVNVFLKNKKVIGRQKNSVSSLELIENEEWFKNVEKLDQALIENKVQTVGFYIEETVSVLTMIKNFKNQNIGYLSVDVLQSSIYNQLEKYLLSSSFKVYMVNNNGKIVLTKNKDEIGQPLNLPELTNNLGAKEGGYKNIRYNKENYLAVYSDLSGRGWRIVELMPMSEVYTGFDKVSEAIIIFSVLSIIFAVFISIWFANYISKPISDLSEIMCHYDSSNTDTEVETDFNNEIGTLYKSYNTMNHKINMLIEDNKAEQELRNQAEIKTLQAQINPHFLYNTLDSISWSAMRIDAGNISDMIVKLSQLLRLSLNGGKNMCTLENEIEQVKLYMELQKSCNRGGFTYEIKVSPNTETLYVPKMIIQPLVENSILHGFEFISDGGLIKIISYINDDKLFIEVEDNGCGIEPESVDEITEKDSKKKGYGIKNVNERIQYLCGKESRITYISVKGIKTVATITLPIIEDFKGG